MTVVTVTLRALDRVRLKTPTWEGGGVGCPPQTAGKSTMDLRFPFALSGVLRAGPFVSVVGGVGCMYAH